MSKIDCGESVGVHIQFLKHLGLRRQSEDLNPVSLQVEHLQARQPNLGQVNRLEPVVGQVEPLQFGKIPRQLYSFEPVLL